MMTNSAVARIAGAVTRAAPRLDRTTFTTSRLLDFCSRRSCRRRPATRCRLAAGDRQGARRQRARRLRGGRHRAGDRGPRRRRRHHDRRQRPGHAGDDGQVDPRLLVPRLVPRGLCLADARRPGQRAEDASSPCRSCSRTASAAPSRSTAQGERHRIEFAVDQIRQQPAIGYRREPARLGRTAPRSIVRWPDLACSILDECQRAVFTNRRRLCLAQPAPDAVRRLVRRRSRTIAATTPGWTKWKPSDPTSPHWYSPERLAAADRRLCGA